MKHHHPAIKNITFTPTGDTAKALEELRAKRYRLKGTFYTSGGKPFVRYYCNGSDGITGWIFCEVKDRASTYTLKEVQAMIARGRKDNAKLEMEEV